MPIVVATALCRRVRTGTKRVSASTQRGGYNVLCGARYKLAMSESVLFLVEKSDSARIEAVIAADDLYLAGINFGLKNRSR